MALYHDDGSECADESCERSPHLDALPEVCPRLGCDARATTSLGARLYCAECATWLRS